MIKGLQGREASGAVRRAVSIDSIDSASDQDLADEFRELLERSRGDITGDLNELSSLGLALAQAGLVDHRSKPALKAESDNNGQDDSGIGDEERDNNGDARTSHERVAGDQDRSSDEIPADLADSKAQSCGVSDKVQRELSPAVHTDEDGEVAVSSLHEQGVSDEEIVALEGFDSTKPVSEVQSTQASSVKKMHTVESRSPGVMQSDLVSPSEVSAVTSSIEGAIPTAVSRLAVEHVEDAGRSQVGDDVASPSLEVTTSAQQPVPPTPLPVHGLISNDAGSVKTAQASIQMAILRQAFETVRGGGVAGADAAPKAGAANAQAVSATTESQRGRLDAQSKAPKALPRAAVNRMLEKVEVAMKEAARSRDGKTIRFRVEPLNLGEVKVDVSLREGALHARLRAESSQVMNALRDRAHELQTALRKLGLDVDTVAVTVSGEENQQLSASGGDLLDGKSFQEEGNNMPGHSAQVVENTFGSELAEVSAADTPRVTNAILDHWVA